MNKDVDIEKLKQKRTQNLEFLNDQIVVSSAVEFLETESKELMIEDDFYLILLVSIQFHNMIRI